MPVPSNIGDSTLRPSGDGFAWRLAVFWAALFIGLGVYQSFFPLWLEAKGLTASEIGLVLAAPMVVRLLTVRPLSAMADRSGRLDRALFLLCGAGALGIAVGTVVDGFWAILILNALVAVAWGPTVPVTDAYALAGLSARRIAYGPIRLWASVAFMLAGLAVGAVLDRISPLWIVWILAGSFAFAALCALLLRAETGRVAARDRHAGPSTQAGLLTRTGLFAMLAAALAQAAHALLYGFGTLHWTGQGHSATFVGTLWSIGVIAEVVLFALSGRFVGRVDPLVLIGLGGAAGVLRYLVLAADPGAAILAIQQVLHALTFGATHLGLVGFVSRMAPPDRQAEAQGLAATFGVAVMAVATALSGPLYARMGGDGFLAMAVLAGLGAVCAVAAAMTRRP
jgi:MFS transporter, PPP family, 3-phenylpropionic acid transporter